MSRTYYFDNLFTSTTDDRETIDELLDAGFPGTTEVDLVNPTYKNEYLTAGEKGIVLGISHRIHDIPVRMPRLNDYIVEKDGKETVWKMIDFNHTDKLLTLVNKVNGEAKQIDLYALQNNFISVN